MIEYLLLMGNKVVTNIWSLLFSYHLKIGLFFFYLRALLIYIDMIFT